MLTIARRTLASRFGYGQRAAPKSTKRVSSNAENLTLRCPLKSDEDNQRDSFVEQAQQLARQENWRKLSNMITDADTRRDMTPAGMPVAELLAYGARSDVVSGSEHVLSDHDPSQAEIQLPGVDELEQVLQEHPKDPMIAAIVAQTHIDVGWAWRSIGPDDMTTPTGRHQFITHIRRATEIMASFDQSSRTSPLLAATNCALLAGNAAAPQSIKELYLQLIDLNPMNPAPMRALGTYLLPHWGCGLNLLELEARRTAERVSEYWGAGGYAWIMCGAMTADPAASAVLDVAFFADAIDDIIARCDDQHTLNWLAACCAMIKPTDDMPEPAYEVIRETACSILRDRLSELHALTWAHAARGFDNTAKIRSTRRFAAKGKETAECFIRRHFKTEIAQGMQVVLTDI